MTIDRAAKVLAPDHREHYDGVVRCRECRYYTSHICCHPGGMRYTCDSDYCSRAEFLRNQSADVRKMEGQPDEEP